MQAPPRLDPRYVEPTHLAPYVDVLERAPHGSLRATCSVPPRHFKTDTTSAAVAVWLKRDPSLRIMYVSYGARLAHEKSRQMRAFARTLGVPLDETVRAKHYWKTTAGGGVLATGIGGDLTGFGCDILIVDDPVKNRREAESRVMREHTWDWYTSTALTRLEPDGSAIVIQTRWHEEDLAGLCADEGYRVISLPAIDAQGRALAPDRFSIEQLEQIRREIGEYDFVALYQGQPRPKGGKTFYDAVLTDRVPEAGRYIIGVDLAHTARTSSDWSAAVVLCVEDPAPPGTGLERLVTVVDFEHAQERLAGTYRHGPQRMELIAPGFNSRIARLQEAHPGARTVWLIGGKEDVLAELMGSLKDCPVHIEAIPADTEIWRRVQPYAAAWNRGEVHVLNRPWAKRVVREHVSFTGLEGDLDDIVAACAGAYDESRGGQGLITVGGARPTADLRKLYT